MGHREGEIRISNSEIPNKSKIRNSNDKIKTLGSPRSYPPAWERMPILVCFGFWIFFFGFVWDFGFRYSNFSPSLWPIPNRTYYLWRSIMAQLKRVVEPFGEVNV